ncbi:MAG: hypothetical protein AAB875_07115 [Patescibacteria group bacterium]
MIQQILNTLLSKYAKNALAIEIVEGQTDNEKTSGSAHILKVAKTFGMKVIGIDISEDQIKAASEMLGESYDSGKT